MDELKLTPTARLARGCLIAAALAPLLCAVLLTSRVPQGRALASQKQLPALAFRQYSVNMHEVVPTAKLTAPFAFWNRSDKPIEIIRLEPSCGCLAPRLLGSRKDYPPGSQGLFEVQVETPRETPGPHTYTVRVHYTVDQQAHEELVTFRCRIPERSVTVTPPELYFYQLSSTELKSELLVTDHRGKSLTVVEAVSESPYLQLTVGMERIQDEDVAVTPVDVAVKTDVPAGSHNTVIVLKTDDADFPTIRVPVFLQGKPKPVQLTSGIVPEPQKQKSNSAASSPTPSPATEGAPDAAPQSTQTAP